MDKRFVCPRERIPANGMIQCETEDGLKLLVANAGDEYFAYQAMCPHQEVPLCEGLYDGAVLTCHQHLWQWDIRTGAAMGLAEAALESFPVRVEGDSLYVVAQSALNAAELFTGISDATLSAITALAQKEERAAGSICYDFGDPADDFYRARVGSRRVSDRPRRAVEPRRVHAPQRRSVRMGGAARESAAAHRPRDVPRAVATAANRRQADARAAGEAIPASGYLVMRRLSSLIARYLASSGSK